MVHASEVRSGALSLIRILSPVILIPTQIADACRGKTDASKQRCTGESCTEGYFYWEHAAFVFTLIVVGATTYYKLSQGKCCQQKSVASKQVQAGVSENEYSDEIQDAPHDDASSASSSITSDSPPNDNSKRMDVIEVKKMLQAYAKSNKEKKDTINELNGKIFKLEGNLKQVTEQWEAELTRSHELEMKLRSGEVSH